jgi:hypothetical protein
VYQTQPSLISQYKTILSVLFLAAMGIEEYLSKLQSKPANETDKNESKLGDRPGA